MWAYSNAHLSVIIFKQQLTWSHDADFYQLSQIVSTGQGNK